MDFLNHFIGLNATAVTLFGAFFICFAGYALGSVKVKGISLGTAGVFLVALLCGWLFTLPGLQNIPLLSNFYAPNSASAIVKNYVFLRNVGLVLFVTGVGFIAGPSFFRNLKRNAKGYVPLGALIILIGAGLAVAFACMPGIGADYATGILSGALTSTPAFSAAQDVAENEALVALGQAVAYPFGVIGVVLFVQIVPKLLHADMPLELARMRGVESGTKTAEEPKGGKRFALDAFGFGVFGLAVVLGILLGAVNIPLTGGGFGGACFSLGMTGGPLIVALILGHFGHIGRLSLRVPEHTLKFFRELGLMFFLLGAGVAGGVDLVSQVQASEHGAMIVLYGFLAGAVMTLVPLVVGFLLAKYVFKLPLLNNLGSLTGGMTSTPALGTLVSVSGTDDVASAYAATYPVALVLVVLAANLIGTFL